MRSVSWISQSVAEQEREAQSEIRKLREMLNPSPVDHGRIPKILRDRLLRAVGRGGKFTPDAESLLRRAFGSRCKILDHWGLIRIGLEEFLACEPYATAISGEDLLRFAEVAEKKLDCTVVVSYHGFHYPGHVLRVLLAPNYN